LLWWAIIGLGFIIEANKSFGVTGVMIFYSGHILADTIWYGLISIVIGTTRKFINNNLYRVIILSLGAYLFSSVLTFFIKL
jgi:hypothetical protein